MNRFLDNSCILAQVKNMTNVNKRTIKWNNGKTYLYFFSYSGAFNCSVIISFITRKNNNVSTPFKNLKKTHIEYILN